MSQNNKYEYIYTNIYAYMYIVFVSYFVSPTFYEVSKYT
jgi:hypothetical protein